MFHEAMLEHEKIIKKVIQSPKRISGQKNPEARQKWIECSTNLMSEEYKLLKSEREIETIKYVFRMEFGEE